jgi:hypothetical protein
MQERQAEFRGTKAYVNRLKFLERRHLRGDECLTQLQQFISIDQSDFDESSTAFTLATCMMDLLRLRG